MTPLQGRLTMRGPNPALDPERWVRPASGVSDALARHRADLARQAFPTTLEGPSSIFRINPIFLSPWALLGALSGCSHPPLDHGSGGGNSDGGSDAGGPNQAPVFASLSDQTIHAGDTLNLHVALHDPDNPDSELSIGLSPLSGTNFPDGASFRYDSLDRAFKFSWPTTASTVGEYGVFLTASDGQHSALEGFRIHVESQPICQARLPIAVMFYDCVDMAPAGETPTHVCLSEQNFGGDLAAAQSFIAAALEQTQRMYTQTCSPVATQPVLFTADRALNAVVGSSDFEFTGYGAAADQYFYSDVTRSLDDLTALGQDPATFGGLVAIHGWRDTLLHRYSSATLDLGSRSSPPYAITSIALPETTDITMPAYLRATLRHELQHNVEFNAQVNHFDRLIYVHDWDNVHCPYTGQDGIVCRGHRDIDGNPLTAADWAMGLGALSVPRACADPEWQANCAIPAEEVQCGTTPCPPLPRYHADCNDAGYCEYSRDTVDQAWQNYDQWIYVPPGSSFTMGSAVSDPFYTPAEAPAHAVTFSQGYFIGKYEVPVIAYEACEADGSCPPPADYSWDGGGWGVNRSPDRALHPQNGLPWNSGGMFCEFVHPGGRGVNEAEWEFAARGIENYFWPQGNSAPLCSTSEANYNELMTAAGYGCGSGGTVALDTTPGSPSPIGAYGMAGNVWEWTTDCRTEDYSSAPSDGSPVLRSPCAFPVLRGGSFSDAANIVRGANRFDQYYTYAKANIGMRCAMSVYPSE